MPMEGHRRLYLPLLIKLYPYFQEIISICCQLSVLHGSKNTHFKRAKITFSKFEVMMKR